MEKKNLKKAEGKCYVCGKQVFPDTVDRPLNIKYTELVSILNNQKTSEGVQKHLIEHCLWNFLKYVFIWMPCLAKYWSGNISQNVLHKNTVLHLDLLKEKRY